MGETKTTSKVEKYKLKAYLAAPFGSKADAAPENREYGVLTDHKYIEFLESIEQILRENGFETHLPHRDTNSWGKTYLEPREVVQKCWDEISSSNLLVAYPERSRGVHIEIGMAASLGKSILILLRNHEEASEVVEGLTALTKLSVIRFRDVNDLKPKLRNILQKLSPS